MNDMEQHEDAFHLTAVDARRYDFGTAMRGYDRSRVDQFRDLVADELERLSRLNQDLEEKARGFHEQLRAFRERDRALNEALISAQQLRADMKEQAAREAELILREAQAEADRLTEEGRARVATLRHELEALERARRTYLAELKAYAERHLAEVAAAERHPSPAASIPATP
jgi:DivIVA domain-containing protein